MSFGAAIGGAATSGMMNNAFSSLDNFHAFEAENNLWLDWIGTGIGKMNAHAEKKKAQKQREWALEMMELEYQYQKRAAQEMPALIRKGYEDAGYNALLALGQTGGAVNASPRANAGDYPHEFQRRDNHLDPLLLSALQTQEAQRKKIEAETTKTKVSTVTSALGTVGGVLSGIIGLKLLAKKKGLMAAMTTNAKQGSPYHRAVDTVKKSKNAAPALGKSASLMSLVPGVGAGAAALGYGTLQYAIGKMVEDDMNSKPSNTKTNARWLRENKGSSRPGVVPGKRRKHN